MRLCRTLTDRRPSLMTLLPLLRIPRRTHCSLYRYLFSFFAIRLHTAFR